MGNTLRGVLFGIVDSGPYTRNGAYDCLTYWKVIKKNDIRTLPVNQNPDIERFLQEAKSKKRTPILSLAQDHISYGWGVDTCRYILEAEIPSIIITGDVAPLEQYWKWKDTIPSDIIENSKSMIVPLERPWGFLEPYTFSAIVRNSLQEFKERANRKEGREGSWYFNR